MIDYLHCYCNCRQGVDWNTCGQAAIATITDYWGLDPYGLPRTALDPNNNLYYWDDGQAIDTIIAGGYGSDVPYGFGTTGFRVSEALASYGLNASVGFSGPYGQGWEGLWQTLQDYLAGNRPVPVMIDLGAISDSWWTVHWAIAYKIADDRVYLGNCPWNPSPATADFLWAWRCWYLPPTFNFCAVYATS
jgi:hypothetical protein